MRKKCLKLFPDFKISNLFNFSKKEEEFQLAQSVELTEEEKRILKLHRQ